MDAQSDWTDSLVTPNGQSFKLDMQKQVDIQNKKIGKLEKKLIEFELNEEEGILRFLQGESRFWNQIREIIN